MGLKPTAFALARTRPAIFQVITAYADFPFSRLITNTWPTFIKRAEPSSTSVFYDQFWTLLDSSSVETSGGMYEVVQALY